LKFLRKLFINKKIKYMEDQKPKKSIFKKWWFWVLLVLVFFVIIGASGSSQQAQKVGQNPTNNNQLASTSGNSQQAYKIGDQVKLGNTIVTVNSIEPSAGGQYIKPQEGNEWINLNITIENTSSEQQYVTTLGQMFLVDKDGNSYQVTVTDKTMSNASSGLDGSIVAKTKRTGWVGFEVKKSATGLKFQYNGSMFGGGNVTVELGR
jgi:hypothetical protein